MPDKNHIPDYRHKFYPLRKNFSFSACNTGLNVYVRILIEVKYSKLFFNTIQGAGMVAPQTAKQRLVLVSIVQLMSLVLPWFPISINHFTFFTHHKALKNHEIP
jgi:hypothetical protein